MTVIKGLCQCGCGMPTSLAKRNRWELGHVKGQPVPFLPSHNSCRRKEPNRFWELVQVDPDTGCWIRRKVSGRDEYGMASVESNGRVYWKPHHVAWVLTHGPIPKGMFVLHKCDNPPCCNPSHLFLGTQAENMADMTAKGRRSYEGLKHRWRKNRGP